MSRIKKINKALWYSYILIFLSATIIFAGFYMTKQYGEDSIVYILYYLSNNFGNANWEPILFDIRNNISFVFMLSLIIYFPISNIFKQDILLELNYKNKQKNICIYPIYFFRKRKKIYVAFLMILSVFFFVGKTGIYAYIMNSTSPSTFIEEQYVDAREVKIEHPQKKRNLILIYLESIESSTLSKINGGQLEVSLTPHLENLALNNVNFSGTDKIGGAFSTFGASWTVGGMVAQSSGLPLKLSFDGNSYNKGFDTFLPGAYTLGDILEEQNYKLKIMMGSDSSFGGRKNYYQTHGNYEIFDWNTAKKKGLIPEDYHEWWGFEDLKLYEYAKTELKEISKTEPFNFVMLTADTHFDEGYLDSECNGPFEDKYENVHWCSSKRVVEFIDWIKKQNFYKNTTIVVIGDHIGMNGSFYSNRNIENDNRRIYNTIINSAVEPIQQKNREFSQFDIFPTIVASLGIKIEGERLGLGTNLFSERKTLVEEYGMDYINNELRKPSKFYDDHLLKDDPIKMRFMYLKEKNI